MQLAPNEDKQQFEPISHSKISALTNSYMPKWPSDSHKVSSMYNWVEVLGELEFGWIDFFKPLDTDVYKQKVSKDTLIQVHTSINSG